MADGGVQRQATVRVIMGQEPSLQLRIAQVAQRVDAAHKLVELEVGIRPGGESQQGLDDFALLELRSLKLRV
jgi:hypothetical protein